MVLHETAEPGCIFNHRGGNLPGSDKIYCLPVPEEEMNAR